MWRLWGFGTRTTRTDQLNVLACNNTTGHPPVSCHSAQQSAPRVLDCLCGWAAAFGRWTLSPGDTCEITSWDCGRTAVGLCWLAVVDPCSHAHIYYVYLTLTRPKLQQHSPLADWLNSSCLTYFLLADHKILTSNLLSIHLPMHIFVTQGAFHQLIGVLGVFPWDQLKVVCFSGNFQVVLPFECGILHFPTVLLPVCSP